MLLFGSQFSPKLTVDVHGFGCGSPPGATDCAATEWAARGRNLIESREGGTRKRRAGSEDVEIGRKIRALRLQRGLSQTSLADGIGLTFQQVQKYEKGTNRVSAGRLQKIADMLDTPVTFFYGGMGDGGQEAREAKRRSRLPADQGCDAADARVWRDNLTHHEICPGGAGRVAAKQGERISSAEQPDRSGHLARV